MRLSILLLLSCLLLGEVKGQTGPEKTESGKMAGADGRVGFDPPGRCEIFYRFRLKRIFGGGQAGLFGFGGDGICAGAPRLVAGPVAQAQAGGV